MDKLKNGVFNSLKWLERYTKTDMIYLARGGFWLGISQFISTLSAFLTSIAFANLLAPDVFGIYKYILSINALLLITTLSGMDSAVTQSVARGFDNTLRIGVKTKMKWGLIGSVISFGLSLYYFLQGNMALTIGFGITGIFVPFSESFDMYNSLLWGKKLFDTQTKYNIVRKITSLIFIVGTLLITSNLLIILLVYFATLTIPAGFFLLKSIKNHTASKEVDLESIPYGKNLSLISIVRIIASELDKILIFHYLGAVNLAVYALAVAPNDQIKGLLKNVNSLAFPQFSQRSINEIRKTIFHKSLILALITGLITIIYILLAPLFFEIFFPKYLSAVIYSQALSVSIVGGVIISFFYTILESQKAKKELYQYNVYENIFSIVILFPLVYFYGIWGAVVSRFISRLFSLLLGIRLIKRM